MTKATLIKVVCDSWGKPCQIKDQHVQTILEHWQDTGRWWAGEPEKAFYRLLCQDGSVYEIFYDYKNWYLYKTYD
ncbi:MAG TPA: DUF6504 family protein [Syntrophomonadaceae bacterium]|nr:DUF6504 family protein [Syntrophomonadaceae bacterium]